VPAARRANPARRRASTLAEFERFGQVVIRAAVEAGNSAPRRCSRAGHIGSAPTIPCPADGGTPRGVDAAAMSRMMASSRNRPIIPSRRRGRHRRVRPVSRMPPAACAPRRPRPRSAGSRIVSFYLRNRRDAPFGAYLFIQSPAGSRQSAQARSGQVQLVSKRIGSGPGSVQYCIARMVFLGRPDMPRA